MLQFDDPLKISEDAKYLTQFIKKASIPYYVFKKNDESTKNLTKLIMTMHNEHGNSDKAHDYIIAAKKFEIIALLYRKGLIQDNDSNSLHAKAFSVLCL